MSTQADPNTELGQARASTMANTSNAIGGPATRTKEARTVRSRASILWQVASALPTLAVLGVLAGIGYYGHHHGWQVPKFSNLTGANATEGPVWCDEHSVPEAICVACNAELMPKGTLHGWCKEHGVSECLFEHPELAQLKSMPDISQEDVERASRALAIRSRPKNDPLCKLHLRRIQFATSEAADKAGIDIGLVDRDRIVESVSANGEVRYDPTRVTRLASRAAGVMWQVEENVGDAVEEGELVALVDAAVVGQAKAELLQAAVQLNLRQQTVQRLAGLDDVVAGSRLVEAEAARDEAEAAVRKAVQMLANLNLTITLEELYGKSASEIADRLPFLGLPPSAVKSLGKQPTSANLIPILSPRAGVVVARDVVAGEVIDTHKTLFTIVDNRQMWLLLDVPVEDVQAVQVGQRVDFWPDGGSREHSGTITWISSRVDAETRTVQVRAELPNDDGSLRDESFGNGQIILRDEDEAIVAPRDAIHWEGCCHVAFVRDRDYLAQDSFKVFHTRMVRPGVTNGDYTEVIAGLMPGEVVVTKGSGVLRAELLKGNLGAG